MLIGTKTYLAPPEGLPDKWWIVDGADKIVGRLASEIAMVLMGKHRPTYTAHTLTGDYVIVINAEKVRFTGKKSKQKEYSWFTGYTGQRRETVEQRIERHPDRVIRDAVRRMLPKNKLATRMLARLKVVAGPNHNHQAQAPEKLEVNA